MSIETLWEQLWIAQDKKCAQCGALMELRDTATPSCSFKIICQKCYGNPPGISYVIMDEFADYTEDIEL